RRQDQACQETQPIPHPTVIGRRQQARGDPADAGDAPIEQVKKRRRRANHHAAERRRDRSEIRHPCVLDAIARPDQGDPGGQ
ncbi:MAG: hypothetical protein ACRCTI_20650, partial [Beijerinckiaceae bacterium]